MQRALELARRALGATSPNPPVGAVIVSEGRVVGEGWTQPVGGPHAEVEALEGAGSAARGSTLYVTLEPCCHQGRTPPCTQAIIRAGIAEAHIATLDPNPRVNGNGVRELKAAGLRLVVGEREAEAREVMEGYLKWITTGLPFVTAKYAMSLDGKIATATGESRWITGEAARRRVHGLRQTCDAVVVGIGTALADNPQLTARDDSGHPWGRQPLRVVVDSGARLPPDAAMLGEPGKTLVATASPPQTRARALQNTGAELLDLPAEDGRVDVKALLQALGARGVTSLLVEGGGTLLATLMQQRLVDKVMAFIAPVLIGGREAPTPVEGPGVLELTQVLRLARVTVERLGGDLLVVGYPGGGS
jgi:diaminohydroxyphosphoribosylaminopyrimidine deaminase/5-amino-6-(5-phosphoribosylamino)uracil reductase